MPSEFRRRLPTNLEVFIESDRWYAVLRSIRTRSGDTYPLSKPRSDIEKRRSSGRRYRNPVIYARELHQEMVREHLTRKQLADRHGVTSDRITQWLLLLKLPRDVQDEVIALGDHWDRKVVTERGLRQIRTSSGEHEAGGCREEPGPCSK